MSDPVEVRSDGALGSVRQLEDALAAAATTRASSDQRLEEARSAATGLLDSAKEEAAAAAAERRRVALAASEGDATEIARGAEERAARVRADAGANCAAVVEAALALVLPTQSEA